MNRTRMRANMTRSIFFAFILIGPLFVGCNDPQQGEWLSTMLQIGTEVDNSERYAGIPIDTKRLIEVAGEPDLRISPEELLGQVAGDTAYRNYVKNELRQGFGRYRSHVADQKSKMPDGPATVSDCTIWVYDERRRFSRLYRTSADVGYAAYFFLVWKSQVLGTACAHHWQGGIKGNCVKQPEG